MSIKVINLTSEKAKEYFMDQSSYFNLDIPNYFNFETVLNKANTLLSKNSLDSLIGSDKNNNKFKISDFSDVNYKLINPKNNKYSWRQLEIIHPLLYVDLLNTITKKTNWKVIITKFKDYKANPNIICCSDLLLSKTKSKTKPKINKDVTINFWKKNFEERSIELSLEYKLLTKTDISECYPSMYTHAISWAIHGKEFSRKNRRDNSLVGNEIDKKISYMRYGQTNGIPQGSNLMDFIAEIVLGYIDECLSEKLSQYEYLQYKILRYRDDYRIFSQNDYDASVILKSLSEVLLDLGMQLNSQKTSQSHNIITNSIKEDNMYWQTKSLILEKADLRTTFLEIRTLGISNPNSGSLDKALRKVYERKLLTRKRKPDNINALIAIAVDIMYSNYRTYPVISAILSKLLTFKSAEEKKEIIEKIYNKMADIPTTESLELWLQRITLDESFFSPQTELAQKVFNDDVKIWNSSWMKTDFKEKIIDEKILKNTPKLINVDEFSPFVGS